MSYDDYRREQDALFQTLQDSEDAMDQRERKRQRERIRVLTAGLKESLGILAFFGSHGIDVVSMPQEILSALKGLIPELWGDPQAEPLINLLFLFP